MIVRLIALSTVSAICGIQALADDGPSYEATTAFIISKSGVILNSYTASDTGIHHSASARVSFPENCVLEKEHLAKDDGEIVHRTIDKVNVSDLDPSRVENRSGQITINTFESRKRIISRAWNKGPGWGDEQNTNYIWLKTFDRDINLPKLKRALVHLIGLCGGKEELF